MTAGLVRVPIAQVTDPPVEPPHLQCAFARSRCRRIRSGLRGKWTLGMDPDLVQVARIVGQAEHLSRRQRHAGAVSGSPPMGTGSPLSRSKGESRFPEG